MTSGELATLRAPLWCPPGREAELVHILCELDDYNAITIDELLNIIPGYEGRVTTELRTLSWRARELLEPRKLAGVLPEQILLTQVDLTSYVGKQLLSISVNTVESCVLVSSLREDGTHIPSLDLDYPAHLYEDESDTLWLHLTPASPALDYHGQQAVRWADRAFAALGMHRSEQPEGTLYSRETYGQVADALGGKWTGSFSSLWTAVHALEQPQKRTPEDGGYWYRLEDEALLIPSTSWHHLYLDRPMDSETYLAAVDALAACGILNPGFANGSRDRGFTSLRRPGLRKPPPWRPLEHDGELDDIPF